MTQAHQNFTSYQVLRFTGVPFRLPSFVILALYEAENAWG